MTHMLALEHMVGRALAWLTHSRSLLWLKNEKEKETKIWRYGHFHSHGSFVQKRATLTACLKKTEAMASNKYVFFESAVNKIREFQNLAYPNTVLKGACTFLAATTGNGAWMDVKRLIQ